MRKLIILFLLISANCFAQFNPFGDGVSLTNTSNTWITTQTFDSLYFNVLHSRTGSSNIFTNGTNGRRLNISNTSGEDSMRIQISTLGNGGLIVNEYGAVYVGNAGNADANDSINFKVALNNTYWRFAQGWTSNGQSGDATTGIGALLPNNADSIIFRGLTGLNTGKYNFIGNLYNNGNSLAITNNTNTFVNDQIFSGRVRTDTILNVLGALTINDTTTVTGRLNVTDDAFFSRDIVTLSTKGQVLGFNSSGTQGIYLNSTADNFLRIRNAGVSTDATVQLGTLIATDLGDYPADATSTGVKGTVKFGENGYIYVCIAVNTWVKVECLTW